MSPDQLNEMFSYVDANIFYFFIKILIGLLVVSLIRELIKNIVSYISFKTNVYVCVGRKVIVNGFNGNIVKIGLNFIVIKNTEKTYLVQTSRWQFAKWEFEEGIAL